MLEATLSTGVTLRYAAQGDPAGVPVVLLHGLTDSHPSYAPMTAHLPDHIRAYALTTRGHGDSDKPEHGYRLEDQAADVAAFLDAVGHEAAVIVGHSMGSYIAQRFAIDHPERTIALVLMGTFRSSPATPPSRSSARRSTELKDPADGVRTGVPGEHDRAAARAGAARGGDRRELQGPDAGLEGRPRRPARGRAADRGGHDQRADPDHLGRPG